MTSPEPEMSAELSQLPMRLSKDSVLQFSPDPGWQVEFRTKGGEKTYTLPSIGWAVVVRWTSYLDDEEIVMEEGANADSHIEPVVLGEQGPQTVAAYLDDVPDREGTTWKVTRVV